jgi:predicted nucleic acid-binding protein
MGTKYLIDTNTLIDAQSFKLPKKGLEFLAEVIDAHFLVSFITYIEFLGYKNISQSNKEFIEMAQVIEINISIIDICIELRKKYRIKLPDAIIAATAIHHNFCIVTNNENDFKMIKNLKCINPYNL